MISKTRIQSPDTRTQMNTPQPNKAFQCTCKDCIKIMTLLRTNQSHKLSSNEKTRCKKVSKSTAKTFLFMFM
jgi:hypothetical protein